jgi:predicted nuclease with TOPRIM domain
MNIQEQILLNAGTLEEGLIFFKESKKLKSLADKISNKLSKNKEKGKLDKEQIKTIENIVKELKQASDDFDKLEKEYKKTNDKKKIREQYKELRKKYSHLIKRLKDEKNKKIFTILGISAIIAGALTGLYSMGIGVSVASSRASDFFLKN